MQSKCFAMNAHHINCRLLVCLKASIPAFIWLIPLLLTRRHDHVGALRPVAVTSRRAWLAQIVPTESAWRTAAAVGVAATIASPFAAQAFDGQELPLVWRDFTKLALLGPSETTSIKSYHLSLQDLCHRLTQDLTVGATGKGGYVISGDLSRDIFRDDCVFLDPNNRVSSLSQYQNALRILFDPKRSVISVIEPLQVNEHERTIAGRFRSRGFLQLPWNPYVTAYESDILYRIDHDGLIYQQEQTWTKSAYKALQETFTPTLFTPPPASTLLQVPRNEPPKVTALFDYVNGRRPDEYSAEERAEIDQLIDAIAVQHDPFPENLLAGTWMLVYLQPGPNGAGIDRRIPFPEFAFNDNFQTFTTNTVRNVGELLGPGLDVRVFGDLDRITGGTSRESNARFQATIHGGELCAHWNGNLQKDICLDLPIHGTGLFDSVYLGERLRIGQNLNGGGARVVQVRLK